MENILEVLALHDYEAVFSIDIATRRYHARVLRAGTFLNIPSEGFFEEANERFADAQVMAEDRDHFLKETRLERILDEIGNNGKQSVRYRIRNEENLIQYRSLSFISSSDKKGLIGAVTDETEDVPDHIEKSRDLWLREECIRFVVRHMCENFIIVNPETDEATTFVHDHRQMQPKTSWTEQIKWFADNIVVPEEKDDYLAYFNPGALVSRIRENGISRVPCTVNYPDGRHDFLITNALIKDPGVDEEKFFVFSSAQDITLLKRANETGESLLEKSRTDSQTGLYNRDMTEKLIRETLYGSSPDEWNTFLLIDIDHFKRFNDACGHILGDAVLRFMGEAMREVFRADDVLCRWGGDEFVIFIPRFNDEASLNGRLVALQDRMKAFKNQGEPMPVTLSIGGVIARNVPILDILFAKADDALYAVKERGRDGIVLNRIDRACATGDASQAANGEISCMKKSSIPVSGSGFEK